MGDHESVELTGSSSSGRPPHCSLQEGVRTCCCTWVDLKDLLLLSLSPAVLFFAAGICNSVMDTLAYHFSSSVFSLKSNPQFWNPELSWINKYRNGDPGQGAKFFGSTTFLVWTQDGWHLFKSGMLLFLFLGVVLNAHVCVRFASLPIASGGPPRTISTCMWLLLFNFHHLAFSAAFNLFWEKVWPLDP